VYAALGQTLKTTLDLGFPKISVYEQLLNLSRYIEFKGEFKRLNPVQVETCSFTERAKIAINRMITRLYRRLNPSF
jgi:hypothetical protein